MGYTVYRMSGDEDKRAFIKFWNDNHNRKMDDKYSWFYDGNPAGKAIVFLVKESQEQQCIGCVAIFPRKLSVDGVDLTVGIVGDLFVHENHRVLLPALKLERQIISCVKERQFDLIYGLPNMNADGVMKVVGFKHLGPNIRIAKVIKSFEPLLNMNIGKPMARILSPFLDIALRLFSLDTWYRLGGRFICKEESEFDDRFDQLWTKAKPGFSVVGERTAVFLTWKFAEKPDEEYKIFTIFDSTRKELAGYIIYQLDENSMAIMDFIFPEDRKAACILMTKFLRHVRKSNPTSVTMQFMENRKILGFLGKFGFVKRTSDWNVYSYAHADVLQRFPVLQNGENWFLSNFDMEN